MLHDKRAPGRIILMGGGEIAKGETAAIDTTLRLSFPKGAIFLFVPTAADESEAYIKTITRLFGKRFSVRVLREKDGVKSARKHIADADIIYFGGGKTELLLKLFKQWKLAPHLKRAYRRGAVLVGMSAGAEALSKKYAIEKNGVWKFRNGCGVAPVACLVHAKPTSAKQAFRALHEQPSGKRTPLVAIGERAAWDIQTTGARKLGKGSIWLDGRKHRPPRKRAGLAIEPAEVVR